MPASTSSVTSRIVMRSLIGILISLCLCAGLGIYFLTTAKSLVYIEQSTRFTTARGTSTSTTVYFPVGVNTETKTITEQATVDGFLYTTLAYSDPTTPTTWWHALTASLAQYDWYQQLAAPVARIVVIWPGERTEQVALASGDILRWDSEAETDFTNLTKELSGLDEGTLLPGRYVTHRYTSPAEMALMINDRFQTEIIDRYPPELAETLPLSDTLVIASLLEREARDFTDMREISGVIWNRLFIDMPLQLDATLQYAKANETSGGAWWPVVRPVDKFIDSPFNTYQNPGLPPSPIANPSPEAILAALNPKATSCFFYFHDAERNFYCSDTYEEHVGKLRAIYGQGS